MWSVVGLWGLALLILVRIALECRIRLISGFHQMKNLTKKNHRSRHLPTMIVLGSGGHTAEMLTLAKSIIPGNAGYYSPRRYVVAATDSMSSAKAVRFEEEIEMNHGQDSSRYSIRAIPRSREVGQSFLTSAFTTTWAAINAALAVMLFQPRLLLANGPGTCIPVIFLCRLGRWAGLMPYCKVVYVESVARVEHLSLSGKILYKTGLTDAFVVQWEELQSKYPKSIFGGRLM
eukprot:jgi/Picsp_1/1616/NSC_05094-R1_udp-n-acetylglucosamine transferase subunit alg14 homolog